LVGNWIANYLNYKIGDEITLNLESGIKKFKISGISNQYEEMITTDMESEKLDMYLTLKNPKNYKKDFKELLGIDPYEENMEDSKYDYNINRNLLHWEVGSFGDNALKIIRTIVIIIITIILVTSVFSIRNSFAISTTEKLKTYGMLSSVGATKKQIRKMVLYEGRKLGLIGIGIGSTLGTIIVYLLTVIINYLAASADLFSEGWMFVYKFSIIPIIIAIIVGMLIIFLSTISCAIKASKVSPIQNLRNADNLNSKKIKLKTPKYIKSIFKIGGVLSYKNLKRSKRKYRVTVISLTVSIFIFITVSSFIEYGLKIIKTEYLELGYNIQVQPKRDSNYDLIEDIDINKITNLDESYIVYAPKNDETYGYIIEDTSKIKYKKIIMPICRKYEYFENNRIEKCVNNQKAIYATAHIIDSETFKKYAKKINANYENIKDKAILINTLPVREDNKTVYKELTNYKVNDEIKLESTNEGIYEQTYKIGAITNERLYGAEGKYIDAVLLVLNEEYVNQETEVEFILINAKKPTEVEEKLKDFENIDIYNIATEVKSMKTMILILSIFVY
jgi:putative ABC transport system permease protein